MYLVYITKFIIFAVRRMRIKYKKILAKYKYINCPSLDVTKYNTKTKEGMIQLVDDYTKTCKQNAFGQKVKCFVIFQGISIADN